MKSQPVPLIGFGAGKGVIRNKDWQLEVKINGTENGLIIRSLQKSAPDMFYEFNFTLAFYAGFPENTVNPSTMKTENCTSGHYAFCTTMKDPSEYCVFQKISVLEGNVVDQVVVTF